MKVYIIIFLVFMISCAPLSRNEKAISDSLSTPEKNFEALWRAFNNRYAFFEVRGVDWRKQYETYRPQVTKSTTDNELFDIMCKMLKPLNDGHVELFSKNPRRYFCAEDPPRFWREFSSEQIHMLFKVAERTLKRHGFSDVEDTAVKILKYAKSSDYGYLRIIELEGHKQKNLTRALDRIAEDFKNLKGYIIDLRECPGGDDEVLLEIINRFTDKKRVAFHRKTKLGPGQDEFSPLKTWHIQPQGKERFLGPIALLTCDSVFSGGDVFALTARELPHLMIIGEPTNGIFSYQLDGTLPNGWEYNLSHQVYLSADKVCYESKGVPVDVKVLNTRKDLVTGEDVVVAMALKLLREWKDAAELLKLSREVQWTFPSSMGRPMPLDPPDWFVRVSAHRESFVKAVKSLVECKKYDDANEVAAHVWRFWILERNDIGGREFLSLALDHSGQKPATRWRALALYGDSLFAFRLGDMEASRTRGEAALKTARITGDAEAEALALLALCRVDFTEGDYKQALAHAAKSLELASGYEPPLSQAPLHMLAQAARLSHDFEKAAGLFQQSLKLNRRIGDKGMVVVELHNLGHVELRCGRTDAAEKLFAECAALGDDTDPYGAAMTLFNRASVAFARGKIKAAAELLKQARNMLSHGGIEPAADDAMELDRLEKQISGALSKQ